MKKALLVACAVMSLAFLPGCEPSSTSGTWTTLAAGSTGRSESACADAVVLSGWEPRPQNNDENANHPDLAGVNGYAGMSHQDQTWDRVHGNRTGPTDYLIQFYACKWGIDDDIIHAEAIVESNWDMDQLGDFGDCGTGAASFGLLQIKKCAHPGTYPYSQNSTSFNLDYYGALIRGCYNGWDYPVNTTGQIWKCVQRWYDGSSDPNPNGAYAQDVKDELAARRWEAWPDAA